MSNNDEYIENVKMVKQIRDKKGLNEHPTVRKTKTPPRWVTQDDSLG